MISDYVSCWSVIIRILGYILNRHSKFPIIIFIELNTKCVFRMDNQDYSIESKKHGMPVKSNFAYLQLILHKLSTRIVYVCG